MSKRTFAGGAVFLIIVIGLFALSNYLSPNRDKISLWAENGVKCLPNGHTNLVQHIHPHLRVIVDGREVEIPANIGVVSNCRAELHTHEGEAGVIHLESVDADKQFRLKDFFSVWGEPFLRTGYERIVFLDTATSTEDGDLILRDKQNIEIVYVGSAQKKGE